MILDKTMQQQSRNAKTSMTIQPDIEPLVANSQNKKSLMIMI